MDEPTIREVEPRLVAAGVPYAEPVLYRERIASARREVEQFLSDFSRRCAKAGVACKVLEDVGMPHEQIELQAQRYDLILMGQQTRFHFETQEGYDDTVRRVLKNSPRPVITVPARLRIRPDEPGHTVLVAYDGSLQSARALHAFPEFRPGRRAAHRRRQRAPRAPRGRADRRAGDRLPAAAQHQGRLPTDHHNQIHRRLSCWRRPCSTSP